MSIALLDVNVLVALFDPAHANHDEAHEWFARNRKHGWATCPITINGFVRVVSNPAYPAFDHDPAGIARRIRSLCAHHTGHRFWEDSISLADDKLFRLSNLRGHQQITAVYLLGLAVRNLGRLATFDRSIPTKAVLGFDPSHLAVIGGA